jgi:hypothetical protein
MTETTQSVNGRTIDNPASRLLLGKTNVCMVSQDGRLLNESGFEDIAEAAKKLLPPEMFRVAQADLNADSLKASEFDMWNLRVTKYAGKTVNVGELWTNEVHWHAGGSLSNTFTLTKFCRLITQDGKRILEINCFDSSDLNDLLVLSPVTFEQKQVDQFFALPPAHLPAIKMVTRTYVDVDTMCTLNWETAQEKLTATPFGIQRTVETETSIFANRNPADQNGADGDLWVARCYHYGWAVATNVNIAMRWYLKAAEEGSAEAQLWIGVGYLNGQGMPKDLSAATNWLFKAAAQDHVRAQYQIGSLYYNGEGVAQDKSEAARWWLKAATAGDSLAQQYLGGLCADGIGVQQDFAEAYKWFYLSASSGNGEAKTKLQRLVPLMTAEQLSEGKNRAALLQNRGGQGKVP